MSAPRSSVGTTDAAAKVVTRNAPTNATPPPRGVGRVCELRSFGRSMNDSAKWRRMLQMPTQLSTKASADRTVQVTAVSASIEGPSSTLKGGVQPSVARSGPMSTKSEDSRRRRASVPRGRVIPVAACQPSPDSREPVHQGKGAPRAVGTAPPACWAMRSISAGGREILTVGDEKGRVASRWMGEGALGGVCEVPGEGEAPAIGDGAER